MTALPFRMSARSSLLLGSQICQKPCLVGTPTLRGPLDDSGTGMARRGRPLTTERPPPAPACRADSVVSTPTDPRKADRPAEGRANVGSL